MPDNNDSGSAHRRLLRDLRLLHKELHKIAYFSCSSCDVSSTESASHELTKPQLDSSPTSTLVFPFRLDLAALQLDIAIVNDDSDGDHDEGDEHDNGCDYDDRGCGEKDVETFAKESEVSEEDNPGSESGRGGGILPSKLGDAVTGFASGEASTPLGKSSFNEGISSFSRATKEDAKFFGGSADSERNLESLHGESSPPKQTDRSFRQSRGDNLNCHTSSIPAAKGAYLQPLIIPKLPSSAPTRKPYFSSHPCAVHANPTAIADNHKSGILSNPSSFPASPPVENSAANKVVASPTSIPSLSLLTPMEPASSTWLPFPSLNLDNEVVVEQRQKGEADRLANRDERRNVTITRDTVDLLKRDELIQHTDGSGNLYHDKTTFSRLPLKPDDSPDDGAASKERKADIQGFNKVRHGDSPCNLGAKYSGHQKDESPSATGALWAKEQDLPMENRLSARAADLSLISSSIRRPMRAVAKGRNGKPARKAKEESNEASFLRAVQQSKTAHAKSIYLDANTRHALQREVQRNTVVGSGVFPLLSSPGGPPSLSDELGGAVNLDCVNYAGRDAVHLAARNGNTDLLKWLHEPAQAVDFDLIGPNGDSAFHLAVWNGHLGAMDFLFHKVHMDIYSLNDKGESSAHIAARRKELEALKWCSLVGFDMFAEDDFGRAPLLHAPRGSSTKDYLQTLQDEQDSKKKSTVALD